jgi:EAL domain-containing protein (putative c-di-GMP-specific phosphodiesterase class I)
MVRLIILPLVLAIALSAVVYYGHMLFDLSNLEIALIAGILFCISMVLYHHLVASAAIRRVHRNIEALNGFERELLRRIDELRSNKTSLAETAHLMERIDQLDIFRERTETALAGIVAEHDGSPNTAAAETRPRFSDGGNVVDLSRRKGEIKEETTRQASSSSRISQIIAAGGTSLMLQPIVQLPGRAPVGLEAFCAIEAEDERTGEKRLVCIGDAEDRLSPRTTGLVERETLNHAAKAVRVMARNGQLMPVFLRLSKATLSKPALTSDICRTVRNDTKLLSNLVFQFPLADVSRLRGEERDNFYQLMELGVPLCASECESVEDALRAIRSGHYKYLKMDASRLLSFGKREGELVSGQILPDCQQIGVSVIASNIEDSNVAAELIDNDILLAQGDLFSPPRPAKLDERRSVRSEKTAER